MKYYAILGILAIAAALFAMPVQEQCSVEATYFCPYDDCEGVLLQEISSAKRSIHATVYSFTLESLAKELKKAKMRGVEVKIVIESRGASSKYSQHDNLSMYGIDILVDGNSGLMHNKFVVVDGKRVITGSANWSKNSMAKNDENIVVLNCKEHALRYENTFWRIWLEGSYE